MKKDYLEKKINGIYSFLQKKMMLKIKTEIYNLNYHLFRWI